jgi:hypothetical protein
MEGHFRLVRQWNYRPRGVTVLGGGVSAAGGSYSSSMKRQECDRGFDVAYDEAAVFLS